MTLEFDEVLVASLEKTKDLAVRQYRELWLNAEITNDKNIDQWFKEGLQPRAIERLLNHLHVYDLAALQDYPEAVYRKLANEIEVVWREKLGDDFVVEQFEDYGPTLTFYRK